MAPKPYYPLHKEKLFSSGIVFANLGYPPIRLSLLWFVVYLFKRFGGSKLSRHVLRGNGPVVFGIEVSFTGGGGPLLGIGLVVPVVFALMLFAVVVSGQDHGSELELDLQAYAFLQPPFFSNGPWVKGLPAGDGFEVTADEEAETAPGSGGSWQPRRPELPQSDQELEELLLVGVFMNGEEVDSMEVLRGRKHLFIPLLTFVELSEIEMVERADYSGFKTPLGQVALEPSEIFEIGGITYITKAFIERELATRIIFDQRDFALRFDLPWRLGGLTIPDRPALKPEILAPGNAFSTMRAEVVYRSQGDNTRVPGHTILSGRLSRGLWRLRYDYEAASGSRDIPEYSWFNSYGKTLVQLGNQRIRLHPLLGSFEMTGAQVGWTKHLTRQDHLYGPARELLSRNALPTRSFHGEAPPGGMAELRIEGQMVARQLIGFDGRYLFLDVQLPARQVSEVEVRIFERFQFEIPVHIERISLSSSEYMLPAGVSTHLGGAGWGGNLASQAVGRQLEREDVVGFYQWRRGMSEKLTLEAGLQKPGDEPQLMAGGIYRLSESWLTSLAIVGAGDDIGYGFDLEGHYKKFRLLARSQTVPRGIRLAQPLVTTAVNQFDHHFELRYRKSSRLELALLGRSRKDTTDRYEYLLPAITWRPRPRMYLRARPDSRGDYRYELYHQFNARSRLFLSIQNSAKLDFFYRIRPRYELSLGSELDDGDIMRYSAIVSRLRSRLSRPSLRAGVIVNDGEAGFLAGASMQILPGLLVRGEYRSLPLATSLDFEREPEFFVQLTTDFAFSRGRLRPARSFNQRRDRGGIAGKITGPDMVQDTDLSGIEIHIAGQRSVFTDRWGNYYVGNIPKGVYRVFLKTHRLPLELSPKKTSFTVQVLSGATTSVDFEVVLLLGLAGRILDHQGKKVAHVLVEVTDREGRVLQRATSDQFGLYRMDELPPGTYLLKVVSGPGQEGLGQELADRLPERQIVLRHEFLFGQDLTLPAPDGP